MQTAITTWRKQIHLLMQMVRHLVKLQDSLMNQLIQRMLLSMSLVKALICQPWQDTRLLMQISHTYQMPGLILMKQSHKRLTTSTRLIRYKRLIWRLRMHKVMTQLLRQSYLLRLAWRMAWLERWFHLLRLMDQHWRMLIYMFLVTRMWLVVQITVTHH